MNSRPAIPEDIKLKVRQKCKFACVVCRSPIYEYHHLIEYSKCQKHDIENIFLLCPNCHSKQHNGNISKDYIIKAQKNLDNSPTQSDKIYHDKFDLNIGNNYIKSFSGYLFKITNSNYFEVLKDEHNNLIINAKFFNKDGYLSLKIEKSEYTFFTDIWDIKYKGGWISFKYDESDLFLKIKFDNENELIHVFGKFYLSNENFLELTKNGIFYNKKLLANECIAQEAGKIAVAIIDEENEQITGSAGFCNCLSNNKGIAKKYDYGFLWSKKFLTNI